MLVVRGRVLSRPASTHQIPIQRTRHCREQVEQRSHALPAQVVPYEFLLAYGWVKRKARFPVKRRLDDCVDAVEFRHPAEQSADAIGTGDKSRGIACTSRFEDHGHALASCPFDCVNDLKHRITPAVPAIEYTALSARYKVGERKDMRVGEIAHMHIISDAGSVLSRKIVPENPKIRP